MRDPLQRTLSVNLHGLSLLMSLASSLPFVALMLSSPVVAFEDAFVLPKGVSRAALNSFHTQLRERSDSKRSNVPMGQSLNKEVTFNDFIKTRYGRERAELEAFLIGYGLDKATVVGKVKADVTGAINVYAPSYAFGISDSWTLGFAIPFYQAQTDLSLAFAADKNADEFIQLLASPEVGRRDKADEAESAINGVVSTLQEKLERNGYKKLGKWQESGLGDILIKAKYQGFNTTFMRGAAEFGFLAPTGRVDDPDILTDIPFGDGSWDLFHAFMLDYPTGGSLFLNVFGKYTAQLPARRQVRLKTANEAIEVEKAEVSYDLGDKVDAGLSLQTDSNVAWQTGVGYQFYHKFKDQYDAGKASGELNKDTEQEAHVAEAKLGYSSIAAFRSKRSSVPFSTMFTYQRQLQSLNLPVTHMYLFDMKLYF